MTPEDGRPRLKSFEVGRVTIELATGMYPILTVEFVLRREDGVQLGTTVKKGPIPSLFDEKGGDGFYFKRPVADTMRAFLDELERDMLPELFTDSSPTGPSSQESLPRQQEIPPTW